VHELNNFRIEGTCNFSGTIKVDDGTFYDNDNNDFTVGTADIIVAYRLRVGSGGDVMNVGGDLTVPSNDEHHSYLYIYDGSSLVGTPGHTLKIEDNESIYVMGETNFPTGFGTITFEELSYARFTANILNQNIPNDYGGTTIVYGRLVLDHQTKTAEGNLDIEDNLYLYNSATFQMGNYSHTIAGHIVNNDNNMNGSIVSSGTVTLDAPDENQYIYDAGSGTYTFENLIFTSSAPTISREKRINDDITVNGDFTVTNTGGDNGKRLTVAIYENVINDGSASGTFSLGENVWLRTDGTNNFASTISSFTTVSLNVESTIRFNRDVANSVQEIPDSPTYGNIEISGTYRKTPMGNIDVNGDFSRVGGDPVLYDATGRLIYVAGDWNMHQNYTELTAGTVIFDGTDQDISNSNFYDVRFHDSGTKTISGTLDILHNLNIINGVTVDANSRYINIEGNWTESGTGKFEQTSGRVTFDGTSDNQTLTTNSASYFYNLTIDKTGANETLTLASNIDVNGTFDFAEDNATLNLEGFELEVARDFYFREGCNFTTNGGKVIFDGATNAQLIRNYDVNTIVFEDVEFKGTAVKRLYNNSFQFNNVLIDVNSTLDGQYFEHFVKGNWNNEGVYRHSNTLYFDGANAQTISQSSFHTVRFAGGDTKTLSGDILLTGHLYIDANTTLDVSASNYNITLDDYWHNDNTGSFIARNGTVTFTGEWNYLFTGTGNTAFGTGSVPNYAGTKTFYNLTINCTNEDSWLILRGDLDVDNNFIINQGDFRQSHDPNNYGINDIYVGGSFICKGQFRNNNSGDAFIQLDGAAGSYTFDPGNSNEYSIINFTGAGFYQFESNLNMYTNRAISVSGGELDLNSFNITTRGSDGDISLSGAATIDVDAGAIISLGNAATFTNNGGIFKLVGESDNLASLIATSGNFIFTQTGATSEIHAKNYRIQGTSGDGIDIQGGSIDETNTFQSGSFSGGTGTVYLKTNVDLTTDRSLTNVTFNAGPSNNVERTAGTGDFYFVDASGTLAGEAHEIDGGTFINWSYSDLSRWTRGAGTDDWHTAGNWSDGVPTSITFAVLDHTTVAGVYSVNISNSNAVAKSLIIDSDHSGGGAITLTLNTKELTIGSNVTIGTNSILTQTEATDKIFVGGSWANDGTHNSGTATVEFNPTTGTHTISSSTAFYNFTINGTGGTNVISSDIDVNGNVNLLAGILNGGTNNINVAGDWSMSGASVFNVGTSTVIFDGSNQNINGGEFYNFTTNNSGTKTATANIDINHDLIIGSGTILDGTTSTIYIGGDWTNNANHASNDGFSQTGAGIVIFDSEVWWQYIDGTDETKFNNIRFSEGGKAVNKNIDVKGNLIITSGYLYIRDAIDITGTSGSNSFIMNGGNLRLQGHSADNSNNFPKSFENINLTNGYVRYYANFNQTVYPTTYYHLRMERVNSGVANNNTKTINGDLTINGNLYINDVETLLDVNGNTINLQGVISFPENGRQIVWGTDGTVNHFGGSWSIDEDIESFNNIIKRNTGYLWLRYRSLDVSGDVSILDDAILRMDSTTMKCTGAGKTFSMAASTRAYIYTPVGSSSDTIAFPINFTNYNLDVNSTVYLRGAEDQIIHTAPTYGNLYLYTQSEINQTLNGDLDVNGDFLMSYDDPTLVDAGHNINIAGELVDIRTYNPTSSTTLTFDGADQTIMDRAHGTTEFKMENVVFAGTGQKTLQYSTDDWYNIAGNLTINSGVTVYVPRKIEFSGSTWVNNGIFNHTRDIVYFTSGLAQSINPGAENDFYAVSFSGGGTKTFTTNGIDANRGIFEIAAFTIVDMGSLTHNIATERVNSSGTWTTENCNLIYDRNGTQYINFDKVKNLTCKKYDQWNRYRYLESEIEIEDLNIEEGIYFRCSENAEGSTPNYDIIMSGNFNNNGTYFYAYGNTVFFENSDNLDKTIKQGNGEFHNVSFNKKTASGTGIYTLLEQTNFYEDLTIGNNATLKLNGQVLRLGNNDPNEPNAPQEEEHLIEAGGTLDIDAGSSLQFSGYDTGNPKLDVDGTLKIVGANGNNANIKMYQFYNNNTHRIDINITAGTIHAQYYLIQHLNSEGLDVQSGATVDATNNFSNGTWADMYTGGGTYLTCNTDNIGAVDVNNVTFNYSGTPTAGTHFNVQRNASLTNVLTFGESSTGLLAGSVYEADEVGEDNTGSSKINWPTPTEYTWVGTTDTDWFTAANWTPALVPISTSNAIIPDRDNDPIISGFDAVCKTLQITTGFLMLKDGYDLTVAEDVFIGIGSDVGILAVNNLNSAINVAGNWTRGDHGVFAPGDGTVTFNATGGSVSIDPRNSAFNNVVFNGGADFMLSRNETFVDGNFTITSGTVSPTSDDYDLHIKGDYNNIGGTFNTSTEGIVYFDASAAQTITNGTFWHLTIDGSNTKTIANACIIDGELFVKNGTFQGGGLIDMNDDVTIEASGIFNDGGNTHTFSGQYWTGTGAYAGAGTIEFDRNTHQYINASKFNNLLFKNSGIVQLNGDVNMTGDLSIIEPNMYLNTQTYQIDNTSAGTGTFSMADERRIFVRGVNNFPSNFNIYNLHENSRTDYDGALDQTIATIPVVYGNLYLNHNTKSLGGHIDVNGNLYMYTDVTLDVTASNFRINLANNWYNYYGATFLAHEGEVIFDGNNEHSDMIIYPESEATNHFYNLTVNKSAGDVRSLWSDITVENNLRVINGIMNQSKTMYVGGDMAALSGTFATSGTYCLNKPAGSSNLQINGSTLLNLTINPGVGVTYTLQDDLLMNGNFNLMEGTFEGNGNLVQMGNYGEVQEINGVYKVGSGGTLQLPGYGTLKVKSGGEIHVVGDPNDVAIVTNFGTGRYYFNVESGATIHARNYMFEYMAENGIYVKDGATIDGTNNFSFGTFTNGASGGTCLKIENNQDFTEAGGNPISEVTFPSNPNGGASNVTKTSAIGTIDFKDYYGEFAGEDFDSDPNNIINWISPPFVMWTGNIDTDWYNIGNWEPNAGADRIPLISDNVIITEKLNQPIINTDGAVAKSIDLQENTSLTLSSSVASSTTLQVANDVMFKGTISMGTNVNTLSLGGNWSNTGMFMPGEGTVTFNSQLGIKSLDNFNDFFYNLHINSKSTVQLDRNLTVSNNFDIIEGAFDVTANNRQLTVKGNFINSDNFMSQNGKLVLSGSNANIIFNPGNSDYNKIDISADAGTTYDLTNTDLSMKSHLNVNSGTLDLNSKTFNFGDGVGTDVISIYEDGILNVNANAYLKLEYNSSVEVNSLGIFKIVGTDADNPAYMQSQSGTYAFNVNNAGIIYAGFYDIQNTNAYGIYLKPGATIGGANKFSDGSFRNGTSGGQYLWLQNNFADFIVADVYFHPGASVNVKRQPAFGASGIITFEDALGSVAGYNFEDDDDSETTGLVQWTYTHNRYIWVGGTSNDWHNIGNWDSNIVPTNTDIAVIPDVDDNDPNWNPIITNANAVCYDLIIEDGGFLTLKDNYNLDADNAVTVANGGIISVANSSTSNINVADIFMIDGTFNHGNSSTVIFDASAGKVLTINAASNFYNLTINSGGNAEYSTGSDINIDGTFTIAQGEFTVSDPSNTIYVGKDWNRTGGIFNHGDGTVVLNGNAQNIINSGGTGNFYNLTLSNGNTKTLSNNITVENNITIERNTTFNGGANTFTLNGDWNNRGTFTPSTGTVYFGGSRTQLIYNYNEESFYSFTLNNTSNSFPQVILYGNLRLLIGGTWTMTDGVFETTTDKMLYVEDNVTLSGGDTDASYVSGPITKIGDDDFVFPIGDGPKFARLAIDLDNAGAATFVAEYKEEAYSDMTVTDPLKQVSGYEHWILNRTSGLESPVVTFYWEDGTLSGIDDLNTLTTAEFNSGTPSWEDRGRASTTGNIYLGTITSSVAFSQFGACGFGSTDENTNPLHGYTKWDGSVSTDWHNANNWSTDLVPTSSTDTRITSIPVNQPVISNYDAVVGNLTIDPGASLDVMPLNTLTTNDRFSIKGSFTLHSDNNGNAAFIDLGTISYAGGDVKQELYLSGTKYHYVSSPMASTHPDRFKSDPVTPYYNTNFLTYNEDNTDAVWTNGWEEYSEATMAVGDGYAVYYNGSPTIIFDQSQSGNFNSANVVFNNTLTYTGGSSAPLEHRGWNFVGNPFPAHLDWDNGTWNKTNIYNSIYFWNGTNYSYYVGSGTLPENTGQVNAGVSGGIIPPMQGFFVKVKEGGDISQNQTGSLTFPLDARTTTSHSYWKKTLKSEIDYIRLKVKGNGKTDETVIRFYEHATSKLDAEYDAFKIFPSDWYGVPQIYSVTSEGLKASINTLEGYNDELIIPLGFQSPKAGEFTIDIPSNSMNVSTGVYLEDTYNDKVYDIRNGLTYDFTSEVGEFNDRFNILFSLATDIEDLNNNLANVDIYSYGTDIYLKSKTNKAILGDVQIVNITGSVVYHSNNTKEGLARINFNKYPAGTYIVKLINEYGVFVEKVFIMK